MKKSTLLYLFLFLGISFIAKAQVTLIPDQNFENKLVQLGIDSDGVMNGQILTSDAQNITQLDLGPGGNWYGCCGIKDFTGLEAFTNLEYLNTYYNAVITVNFNTLIKLKRLVFFTNYLTTIDLSNNIDLESLVIGNDALDMLPYNMITKLDLSSNAKVKYLNVYNLFTLEMLNMRNNKTDTVDIILGNENEAFYPYNVCIEVDDHIAATNGTTPYDKWTVYGNHFFSDNCVLSVEKFVNENFKIYPSPATEYVTIEQKETNGVTLQAVQILDSSGKWVRSVKEHFNHIDVSNLSKGMYLFVIQTDKGNKTEKIVVK